MSVILRALPIRARSVALLLVTSSNVHYLSPTFDVILSEAKDLARGGRHLGGPRQILRFARDDVRLREP